MTNHNAPLIYGLIGMSILLGMILLFFSSGEECKTKECFDYKVQQEQMKQAELESKRLHELESLRIQAEIEASKPIEVKVAEIQKDTITEQTRIQNSGMTTGEGIATGVGIATVGYGLYKLFSD